MSLYEPKVEPSAYRRVHRLSLIEHIREVAAELGRKAPAQWFGEDTHLRILAAVGKDTLSTAQWNAAREAHYAGWSERLTPDDLKDDPS